MQVRSTDILRFISVFSPFIFLSHFIGTDADGMGGGGGGAGELSLAGTKTAVIL